MGKTITEKLLSKKAGKDIGQGDKAEVKVDGALIQSYTGAQIASKAFLQGAEKNSDYGLSPKNIYIVDDHVFTSPDPVYSRAQNVEKMLMQKIKGNYVPRGNGPLHYYAQEKLMSPGQVWISADSHGPQNGCLGTMVEACGGAKLLRVLVEGRIRLEAPNILFIDVIGSLSRYCSAKDAAIALVRILKENSIKGIDYGFEFGGEGWKSLNIAQRSTLCNLSVDHGARSVLAPSDEVVKAWLEQNNRAASFEELSPDPDAGYAKKVTLDLDKVEPMVILQSAALEGAKKISELDEDIPVNVVRVESCTNASFFDMESFHKIMQKAKGLGWNGRFHKNVRVSLTPGSKDVQSRMIKSGMFEDIYKADGVINTPSCSGCIGVLEKPDDLDKVVTTAARGHQPGRLGSKAYGITAGPEAAAMAAIFGRVVSPSELENGLPEAYPEEPDKRKLDQIRQEADQAISKQPIEYDKLNPELTGRAWVADDISTDDISPGSKGIRRIRIKDMRKSFFAEIFPDMNQQAQKQNLLGNVVAARNFGVGASSREIAADGIRELQLLPIAVKWGKILYDNLINVGVPPLTISEEDYGRIKTGDEISVDFEKKMLIDRSNGSDISFSMPDPSSENSRILAEGGILGHIRKAILKNRQ
ncbi:hypothetical protein KY358_00880 [Candidatus Woesearchaeota archaeon]|nr:hypothetical protein [Candidatus Woesearchaeota archaeon]